MTAPKPKQVIAAWELAIKDSGPNTAILCLPSEEEENAACVIALEKMNLQTIIPHALKAMSAAYDQFAHDQDWVAAAVPALVFLRGDDDEADAVNQDNVVQRYFDGDERTVLTTVVSVFSNAEYRHAVYRQPLMERMKGVPPTIVGPTIDSLLLAAWAIINKVRF